MKIAGDVGVALNLPLREVNRREFVHPSIALDAGRRSLNSQHLVFGGPQAEGGARGRQVFAGGLVACPFARRGFVRTRSVTSTDVVVIGEHEAQGEQQSPQTHNPESRRAPKRVTENAQSLQRRLGRRRLERPERTGGIASRARACLRGTAFRLNCRRRVGYGRSESGSWERVREDLLVGFVDFLQLLLGLLLQSRVVGKAVRMPHLDEVLVGLLQFLERYTRLQPEHPIVPKLPLGDPPRSQTLGSSADFVVHPNAPFR